MKTVIGILIVVLVCMGIRLFFLEAALIGSEQDKAAALKELKDTQMKLEQKEAVSDMWHDRYFDLKHEMKNLKAEIGRIHHLKP